MACHTPLSWKSKETRWNVNTHPQSHPTSKFYILRMGWDWWWVMAFPLVLAFLRSRVGQGIANNFSDNFCFLVTNNCHNEHGGIVETDGYDTLYESQHTIKLVYIGGYHFIVCVVCIVVMTVNFCLIVLSRQSTGVEGALFHWLWRCLKRMLRSIQRSPEATMLKCLWFQHPARRLSPCPLSPRYVHCLVGVNTLGPVYEW